MSGIVVAAHGETVVYDEGRPTEDEADHIARHDPARVLREVAAKRAILELADDATSLDAQVDSEFRVESLDPPRGPYCGELIIRALAAVYSGHADYPLKQVSPTPPSA